MTEEERLQYIDSLGYRVVAKLDSGSYRCERKDGSGVAWFHPEIHKRTWDAIGKDFGDRVLTEFRRTSKLKGLCE